jgi:hypothetical protein
MTSTISGGYSNRANGENITIGGESNNVIDTLARGSTIASGSYNKIFAGGSGIGGGERDTIIGFHSTIAGGVYNLHIGDSSTIGGGYANMRMLQKAFYQQFQEVPS